MSAAPDCLRQLLRLASLLGGDGVPLLQQLHQITYVLVLRLAQLPQFLAYLPAQCDWQGLAAEVGSSGVEAFNLALIRMRDHASPPIAQVFEAAPPALYSQATLEALLREIDHLPWASLERGELGRCYEALLVHYAALPRANLASLASPPAQRAALLALARPTAQDFIVDPAAGFGSLLTAAAREVDAQPPRWPRVLAGRCLALLPRRDCRDLAIANLLLNGLAPVPGATTPRGADPGTPDAYQCLPAPTLIISDLASQRLPLRQELSLLRSLLTGLREEGRAVLRVSAAVAGNSATARRLRTEFSRRALRARFSPASDGSLLLQLSSPPQGPPVLQPARADGDAVPLGELVTECRHGLSTARQVPGEGTAMLRASGVCAGYIRGEDRCSVRTPADCAASRLAIGDLLFVRNGSQRRVGVCGLVHSAAVSGLLFPDKLIRIRVDTTRVLPEWVAACVNGAELRGVLQAGAIPSTGQYRITRKQLLALRIPLPSLTEQQQLLQRRPTAADQPWPGARYPLTG